MRKALVTTTIHVPDNLRQWATHLATDDLIIVAGDLQTPHREVESLLADLAERHGVRTVYLNPHIKTDFVSESVTGTRVIQRRNLATLTALSDPDVGVIITVDDDNFPSDDYGERLIEWFPDDPDDLAVAVTASSDGWFNVGQLCVPSVTHRGYPLDRRGFADTVIDVTTVAPRRVGVFASLWTGEPDVDAIERACRPTTVTRVRDNIILARGTWSPFNSQATAWRREVAPLMHMWLGVGRMDDIWCSYAARAVMDVTGWHVAYGHPTVHQYRNEHDIAADIEAELRGYRWTSRVVAVLRDIANNELPHRACHEGHLPSLMFDHILSDLAQRVPGAITERTIAGWKAWATDIAKIEVQRA